MHVFELCNHAMNVSYELRVMKTDHIRIVYVVPIVSHATFPCLSIVTVTMNDDTSDIEIDLLGTWARLFCQRYLIVMSGRR